MASSEVGLDGPTRAAIVAGIQGKLRDAYIFPDMAEELARAIGQQLAAGEYEPNTGGAEFATTLTSRLQAISHDKHLRVYFDVESQPLGDGRQPDPVQEEHWRQIAAGRNYGFERVERLAGNIDAPERQPEIERHADAEQQILHESEHGPGSKADENAQGLLTRRSAQRG